MSNWQKSVNPQTIGAKSDDIQIIWVKDIKAAGKLFKTLLQPGDLLYLQNDLPETYR